jgi:hypothetical protein
MSASRIIASAVAAAGLGGAAWYLTRKADETEHATIAAVQSGGRLKVRLTGYWPFSATEGEQKMEGGTKDRKGKPLHTLEQHLADPSAHPYVSVSGDDAIFPYGQRIQIDEWPGAVFRVVDTGGHFRGAGKVYRALGREPLDIAVDSKRTKVTADSDATIMKGDHLDKPGKEIAAGKFKGQEVMLGGLDVLGAVHA